MRSIRAVVVLIGIVLSAMGLLSYDASASNDDGLSKLAACVGEREHLLVLGLVDESGSLRATDPEARRVDGLLAALSTLAATTGRADSAKIEILLAGFATSYTPLGDWLPLNRDTLPILRERAESFRTQNRGNDTDFYEALSHAQESLGRKASEVGTGTSAPCRALLLFTDGGYEFGQHGPDDRVPYAPDLRLDGRGNWERVVARGRDLICKPDGLVDQLRAAQTSIVTIALTKQNNPSNLTFLESIGLQSATDGTTCGHRTDWLGAYIPVDNVGDLLNAFRKAVCAATGGTCVDPKTCPFNAAQCQINFEIDKSLRAFGLHINLGAPGVVAEIRSPRSATPLRLQADESATPTFGSAMLSVFPDSPLNLDVHTELPANTDDWVGTWSVTFVDPTDQHPGAIPSLQITMFGGLAPVVDPLPVFQAGKRSEFEIRVLDRMGSPQTPASFGGSATVTATVTDPVSGVTQSLDVQGGAAGRYRSGYTLPAATTALSLNLAVTLDVVTKGGVHLQPSQRTYQVPVRLPPSFPTIVIWLVPVVLLAGLPLFLTVRWLIKKVRTILVGRAS